MYSLNAREVFRVNEEMHRQDVYRIFNTGTNEEKINYLRTESQRLPHETDTAKHVLDALEELALDDLEIKSHDPLVQILFRAIFINLLPRKSKVSDLTPKIIEVMENLEVI